MTTIKDLDLQKRKLHKDKYLKKYPNGMFAVRKIDNLVYLEWSHKEHKDETFTLKYNTSSFFISSENKFGTQLNSLHGSVTRYSSIESLVRRARKLNLGFTQLHSYITLYLKFTGKSGSAYSILKSIK